MARITENGQGMSRRPAVWLCLFSLAFLAACGCSTTNKNKGDPLMGEFGPKGEVKPPATKTSSNQVPPIPTASSGVNNSNLAAGTLPGSRNLAITQPQANADPGPGSLTAGSKDNANAVLARPEPVIQPVPRDIQSSVVPASNWDKGQKPPQSDPLLTQQPPAGPPPGQQPAAVNPLPPGQPPADPLQVQLKSRGVSWQRAENVAGGVKFSCLVPNPQNPQVSRAYEAIGPDYPAAVRAVLWEIDNRK
jgi:hypothetical protein